MGRSNENPNFRGGCFLAKENERGIVVPPQKAKKRSMLGAKENPAEEISIPLGVYRQGKDGKVEFLGKAVKTSKKEVGRDI